MYNIKKVLIFWMWSEAVEQTGGGNIQAYFSFKRWFKNNDLQSTRKRALTGCSHQLHTKFVYTWTHVHMYTWWVTGVIKPNTCNTRRKSAD